MVNKEVYKAFGLRLSSEIPLPELPQTGDERKLADVEIEMADLSRSWVEAGMEKDNFALRDGRFWFQIPGTARFCISEGKEITVSPLAGSEIDKIRLYILGTCMGVLLLQRNILPLHGSAVLIDGKAYAIVGDSGAGKSTLAAAFVSRGYRLLSDDVIAVSSSPNHTAPTVYPSYPQQKLWQESLQHFGMETKHYHPVYQEVCKYAVPVPSGFHSEPVPLAGVFELLKTDQEEIDISRLQGLERLRVLIDHTYRSMLIYRLGLEQWHFHILSGFASRIAVSRLNRPASGFTANQLVTRILETLNRGE